MARLPQPGSDQGKWGDILNDFLAQSLASDGLLKPDSVGTSQLKDNAVTADIIAPNSVTNAALASNAVNAAIIADGSITEALLDGALQAKVNAGSAVASVAGKTGAVTLGKADVGLDNVDNTSDANKPVSAATQAALNGKLDKTTSANVVYATNNIGLPVTVGLATIATPNTFAYRDVNGRAQIATPTTANEIANKSYVDTAAASKQTKFMTGTCTDANGTVAKTVTLDAPWVSHTLAAGDWCLITFASGNNVSNITLGINGAAGAAVMTPNGQTVSTALAVASGNPMLLYYTGSAFVLAAGPGTLPLELQESEIDGGSATTLRTMTGRRAAYIISKSQPRFMTGTVAAASGTVAKTVTLDAPWASYTPAAGDFFFVTFTNGNAVAAATLSINGTAARNLMTPNGSTLNTSLSVAVGNAVLMYYGGGSSYTLVGAPQNTVYAEISQAEIVDAANSTTRLMTGRRAEDLLVYEATKERTLTNKTISGTDNILTGIPLATAVSGILPVASGGTGSATQNFVDLTTGQTIAGNKTLSGTTYLSGGVKSSIITRTGSATLSTTSPTIELCNATAANLTITLPTAATNSGITFTVVKTDATANTATLATTASQTINGVATYVLSTQWQRVTVVSDGTNWVVTGA